MHSTQQGILRLRLLKHEVGVFVRHQLSHISEYIIRLLLFLRWIARVTQGSKDLSQVTGLRKFCLALSLILLLLIVAIEYKVKEAEVWILKRREVLGSR